MNLVLGVQEAYAGQPAKVLVAGLEGELRLAAAWLEIDPLTNPSVVPARAQDSSWSVPEIRRFVRLYFPRNYERLLEFEYMILAQIDLGIPCFSVAQQQMLYDSIYVGGLGGMNTRSVMSMHIYISTPWAQSVLSDAFPNDADAVVSTDYTLHQYPMRVVINTNENVPPVYKPYKDLPGVEYSFAGAYGTNLAIPKPGAVVVSYSVGPHPVGYAGAYPDPRFQSPGWIPHSMYWKFGKGITWTHQDMFGQYWNTLYNPYAPDMVLAEIIYSTGRKLPDDVVQLHRLRVKFTDFSSYTSFINAIMDFIDKFGANPGPIASQMVEISKRNKNARDLYLDQAFEESSAVMDEVLRDIVALRDQSLKLKDRALLWIYVVEWLSVTGIALIAGFAVWTLMVRRRLYREVARTRMSSL